MSKQGPRMQLPFCGAISDRRQSGRARMASECAGGCHASAAI